MKKETYIKFMNSLRARQGVVKLIKFLYTALPFGVFAVYPVIILLNGLKGFDHSFILSIVVPAVTLVGVGIMRKLINKKRPYEKFGVCSLIEKDKKGQSFPSNHAACGFVIAMAGFTVNIPLGITLLFVAFIIALTRIFAGVHFISDVVAGVAIGTLAGLVFLFI